jgi:hypothetical protein
MAACGPEPQSQPKKTPGFHPTHTADADLDHDADSTATAETHPDKPKPEPDVTSTSPSPKKDAAPPPQTGNYEYGKPVPGKPGFVTSPYAPYSGYVDVRGYPPGTEVKDPYTQKIFLVPAQ